jgi:uncharacterized membrane protein YcaP (DUF421 family)
MSNIFCKYKNIFGKENTGIHKYRVLNIAVVDFLGTLLGAIIIAYYFKLNYIITILIIFLLAIIIHRLFCVNTTINKFIFGTIV